MKATKVIQLIAAIILSISFFTCKDSNNSSIGSTEERLAVAAQIRHHLRDQDIPALVVASGTKLTIHYKVALIEYAPDTFFRQQGEAGMKRIANAGFKTLVIEANDTSGKSQRKEFSVTQYISKQSAPKEASPKEQPKAEITQTRLVPFVTAQGKSLQMVLIDWKNTGGEPIKEVYADISAYDERGNLLSSSAKDYCIFAVESDSKAIKTGETYTEPDGEGFVLIPLPPENAKVKRVTATLTRLSK